MPVLSRSQLLLIAKLSITAVLVWWIFNNIDGSAMWERMKNLSIGTALAGYILLIIQSFIAALRLNLLTPYMAKYIGPRLCWQYTLIGLFFNQALPSTVGGDGVKVWFLSQRQGWTLRSALHCIIIDRALGLLTLLLLIVLSTPWLMSIIANTQTTAGLIATVFTAFVCSLAFILIPRFPRFLEHNNIASEIKKFHNVLRSVFLVVPVLFRVTFYGFSVHFLNVLIIWIMAQDVGIAVSLSECMVIVPTVLLLSVIPISIAGWGLREGIMVAGFSYIGMPATDAVFLSITLGIGMTAVGLTGGPVWMLIKATETIPDDK